MKSENTFAFYETAATEEQKQQRLALLKKLYGKDPGFYSVYIDVAPRYDSPRRDRKALRSLTAAIGKGRIRTLVIPGVEGLYMHEGLFWNLYQKFLSQGVHLAVDRPSQVLSDEEGKTLILDAAWNTVMNLLQLPALTMESCYVTSYSDTPTVYLEKDRPKDFGRKALLRDVIEQHQDTGIFLFRSDVQAWYHIAGFQLIMLQDLCRDFDETVFSTTVPGWIKTVLDPDG